MKFTNASSCDVHIQRVVPVRWPKYTIHLDNLCFTKHSKSLCADIYTSIVDIVNFYSKLFSTHCFIKSVNLYRGDIIVCFAEKCLNITKLIWNSKPENDEYYQLVIRFEMPEDSKENVEEIDEFSESEDKEISVDIRD